MTRQDIVTESTLTCPHCGHSETLAMPVDACQWSLECSACATVLTPLPGDCCVFCSYAMTPCPPIQSGEDCSG